MRRELVVSVMLLCGACGGSQANTRPPVAETESSFPPYHPTQANPAPTREIASGPPPRSELKASSGFDVDADGWTVVGDAQGSNIKPDFNGTGGNPDGLISAKDNTVGGTYYFVAPEKYLGDVTVTYGKHLTFDLKTTALNSPFKAYGVMLAGAGTTIVTFLAYDPDPVNTWKSYSIALDPSAGWKLVPNTGIKAESDLSSAPAASERDLRTVLGALNTLRIRGEFNTGPDTGALDNVRFGI
jgi:Laminin B (Domain IV)